MCNLLELNDLLVFGRAGVCSHGQASVSGFVKELTKGTVHRVKALTSSIWGETKTLGVGAPRFAGTGSARVGLGVSWNQELAATSSMAWRISRAVVSASTVAITTWDARAF
jgi:hypothetical protein